MQDSNFRERQVLADLQRVAALQSVPNPWSLALAPDTTPERRTAATATLLHLVLATETPDPATDEFWSYQDDFLAQPARIRAALMNGFDMLCLRGFGASTCQPTGEACVTYPRADLERYLIALARQMTPAEIDHISRADYGNDVARHKAALLALLADGDVAYPSGEAWYPAEVVELVSHVPGSPGHVPCTAIVLLDALRTGDLHGNAEFRLGNQFTQILTLPEPARTVLIAAFRHIYETERDWNPSVPTGSLPMDQTTLPWTELP